MGHTERRAVWRRVAARLDSAVGGTDRRRVVLLLAAVLALDNADLATIGAVAGGIRADLHISNFELGAAAAASTLVGAVATIPSGLLADRSRRVNLLAGSVALWTGGMIAAGASNSLLWLVVSRLALGAVTATAAPVIASLTGDYFEPTERARIYGYILTGELVGAGVGFALSGNLAAATSWRIPFFVLAACSALLAWRLRSSLAEPPRRAQVPEADDETARRVVAREEIAPRDDLILGEDPRKMPLRRVARHVLRIRTNLLLIVASAIGYYFFAGLRTFAVVFVSGHFGVGQGTATTVLFVVGLGAVAGVLAGGRLADALLERGRVDARIVVPAAAFGVAAAVLLPALLLKPLALAAPLMFAGGAALSFPNPPLDAARLDIVPAALWGRAESVRAVLRNSAQAIAPLTFGLLADVFSGPRATGVEYAFLIMLVPLALNGFILYRARRSYPRDVATAMASDSRWAGDRAPAASDA